MGMDVLQALRRLDQQRKAFDIIFMDPPYSMGLERRILPYLTESSLVQGLIPGSLWRQPWWTIRSLCHRPVDGMWRESKNIKIIVIYLFVRNRQQER